MEERDSRQRDLIPRERLSMCRATVVGVGAIGRQVALQLAAMGVPWLQLVDHDTVEIVNLAPQGYLEADLGKSKVEATGSLCRALNSGVTIEPIQERFRRSMDLGNVLFCCVDSIATRRLIWDAVRDRLEFFCDGRMSADVLRVLAACDKESRAHYGTTLFPQEEAYQGSCTSRSTIFCANIAAGFMLSLFARWLRCLPVDKDVMLNLLSSEFTAR